MALLKRREVNNKIEEQVLTGMIVSDSFCRDISKVINKDSFSVPFVSRAVGWCQDYYKKYRQAPGMHIADIFEVEKEKIDADDSKAISTLLTKLSNESEGQEFNEEYLKDRALEHFHKRQITLANEKSSALINLGRFEEAEKVWESYKKTPLMTAKWTNVFDSETIKNSFADESKRKDNLFQLPGDLGKFIGPFQRNWLMGFLAPTKRGKSFWLIELAIQAAFARKKVIIVSLEMNERRVLQRAFKRIVVMPDETKDYIYPSFDCQRNQDNTCDKPIRTNKIRLLDLNDKKPQYDRSLPYKVCQKCRGEKDFVVATWFTTKKKDKMKTLQAIKSIKSTSSHFGKNLKLIAYPAFSANISRVRSDISILADTEDFVPDLIVIDYADILAPEDARVIGRDRIDETWKTLKRMADELHCCVASASQSNRQSFGKKNVTQVDTSEDIRKISNSDLFLAINQTPQEKRDSCTRISKIAARDEDFDEYQNVIVLQNLALGQVLLESCSQKVSFVDLTKDFSI